MSKQRIAFYLFFILLIAAGLRAYDDYGIAWDEPLRHNAGKQVFSYLIRGESVPETASDDHGVVFELLLVGIEKVLSLDDTREIFLMRHLFSHLFFIFGVFGFFLLARFQTRNGYLAMLGAVMLVLSPRIYAHSFFNTKDIPFMVLFIFCLYSLVRAFDARSKRWFILHGALCGLLTGIRVIGIMLVVFTLLFLVLDYWHDRKLQELLVLSIPFLFVFAATLFASWPFLWHDPIGRFIVAFRSLSNYLWSRKVLYFGEFHRAYEVPWHYPFVWIAITTPIAYMVAFLMGTAWTIRDTLRSHKASITELPSRNNLLFLMCFGFPLISVVILNSTLYDGWRHLFFIYPCFLLLATDGIRRIVGGLEKRSPTYVWVCAIPLIVSLASTLVFMNRNHPHQNVYFNILLPRKNEYLRKNWELDYWGVSYRQGLEYILSIDPSDHVKVSVATHPGQTNAGMLDRMERGRLEFVSNRESADYFITNYRWHPKDYLLGTEIYSIVIQGSRIMSVYKIP
jgi:hypothetical protein